MINKSSAVTEEIFKKLCKEKRKSQVSAARLTKGKLLAYLSRRYKGPVAKIMSQIFDFSNHYDYDSFIEEIEQLINFKKDSLLKMAFQVYDYDQDHSVCQLDLYTFLKNYEHDEECFLKAYAPDISKIEEHIDKKRSLIGFDNSDVKFKLKDIDNKLKELGGRLEVDLLKDFNVVEDESERSDYSEEEDFTQPNDGKSVAGKSRIAKSRKSVTSRKSRMSSRHSRASSRGSNSGNERTEKEHPYDKIFSKKVTSMIKKTQF